MFSSLLHIRPGITTIIGSGGKTTLLETLGRELAEQGEKVILCTTTNLFPFPHIPCITNPEELEAALKDHSLLCAGTLLPNGKLAAPAVSMETLAVMADFVLVEGDGSKRLPLKAHLPHEPVIPPESSQTISVVGLSGLYRPIAETVHRPDRFAALAGNSVYDPATPEAVAKVLKAENLADRYLLNQAEHLQYRAWGYELRQFLPEAMLISLHEGEVYL